MRERKYLLHSNYCWSCLKPCKEFSSYETYLNCWSSGEIIRFNTEKISPQDTRIEGFQKENSIHGRNMLRLYDLSAPIQKCYSSKTCAFKCMVCSGQILCLDDKLWNDVHYYMTDENHFGLYMRMLAKEGRATYVKQYRRVFHKSCTFKARCGCFLPRGASSCLVHPLGMPSAPPEGILATGKRQPKRKMNALASDSEDDAPGSPRATSPPPVHSQPEPVSSAPIASTLSAPIAPAPTPPAPRPPSSDWATIMKKMKPAPLKGPRAAPKSKPKPAPPAPKPTHAPPPCAIDTEERSEWRTVRCRGNIVDDDHRALQENKKWNKPPLKKPQKKWEPPKEDQGGYVWMKGELCYKHKDGRVFRNVTGAGDQFDQ